MVIKFSSGYIDLAYEIKVLTKVTNQAKKLENTNDKKFGLPSLIAYGVLVGANPHPDDIDPETNLELDDEKTSANLFAYYIMPKYNMTLEEYLGSSRN